jgi:hypothetical protein
VWLKNLVVRFNFAVNKSFGLILRRKTMKKTFLKLTVLALAGALALAACGDAEAGPAGTPGIQGPQGPAGGVGVMVYDDNDQFIGYLVSADTSATGNYTVYNPSAISAAYPDGVFSIGKDSYHNPLAAWTGSGTVGTFLTTLYYTSNDGTGTPMYPISSTAYRVGYNYWNGTSDNVLTYYYWKNDADNNGFPDSGPDATAGNSSRSSANPSVLTQNSAGTDTFYELKTITAGEIDTFKANVYSYFLANTGLNSLANPITWPLHLDVTE